ncbi:SPOR domain-containing protein [Sphingomonas abaci]|uniref:SPOR domain-containing protein n=1 Tax=Sphingomonas abaci TaxID=237611 RepID=A0A7W7AGM8_9SPHN|nr:SPOR domain-containing protein [Sphingomonas abaci]MBB4616511.1 hypothetical protein [Sphingomonas abaci]
MIGQRFGWLGATTTTALLLAGCAHRQAAEPAPPPPAPAPTPAPAPPPPPPETINSHLGEQEALWHVRAALNVAALSCGRTASGATLTPDYNRLLVQRKTVLAAAYRDEQQRFDAAPGGLDHHMTVLYNYFARPGAQTNFCPAAAAVATEMTGLPADALAAAAGPALARLEAALLAPPPPAVRMAAAPAAAAEPLPAGDWRIQIGAFTGQARAEAAWALARDRAPSLAKFQPRFDPVPNSPLVRVQIGPAADRAGAVAMCAAAAAGGFDCLPLGAARR